jgi:4-amino-4-deoxy-L-arabinose transferase-like glycosyltransferase
MKIKSSLVLLSLILLYWLTRFIALDSFSLFLDEAGHLWWARDVWRLHPFGSTIDGRWLNVLWIAVFYPFNATIWIARASVVLVTTAGFACVLATTRRYFSLRATVIAGLLYIFMPLTFFFERLALADSISAPFVAAAIWAASVKFPQAMMTRARLGWGVLGGVMLTAAILSKISNLIFLCIPFLAAVFLFNWKEWRKGLTLASAMYMGCAITLAPIVIFIRSFTSSTLGLNLVTMKTGGTLAELPAQIIGTSQGVTAFLSAYLPFPMWLIILIGIGAALWRGGRAAWFNASVLAATMAVLIAQTRPAYLASRFLPVYAPLIVILVGSGLAAITFKWRRVLVVGGVAVMIGSGVMFAWQGWIDPTQLPLEQSDRWHYITGWPNSYALRDVTAEFLNRNETAQIVALDLGSTQKMDGYLLGRTTKVTTHWYRSDFSLNGSWLIIEATSQMEELARLNLKVTEVKRYYRPGNSSPVILYRVDP